MFWSSFLMRIWWWCSFCDWSDHIWQYQQTCKCYICSGVVFWCGFNGDGCFVIGVTIYGNTGKHISVIYVLEWFLMWIQWWCLFCDQSDYIWQCQQTCKCYICFGVNFSCEFNGDVHWWLEWLRWSYMVISINT